MWFISEIFMKRSTEYVQIQFSDWQIDIVRILISAIFISIIFVVNTSLLFGVAQNKMGSHSQSSGSFTRYMTISIFAAFGIATYYTIRSASPREIGEWAEAPLVMSLITGASFIVTVYCLAYLLATFARAAGSGTTESKDDSGSQELLTMKDKWKEFLRNPKLVEESESIRMGEILDDRILETFNEFIIKRDANSFKEVGIFISVENIMGRFFPAFWMQMGLNHGWKDDIELQNYTYRYIFNKHGEEMVDRLIHHICNVGHLDGEIELNNIMVLGILTSKGVSEGELFDNDNGIGNINSMLQRASILTKSILYHWADVGGRFPDELYKQNIKKLTDSCGKPPEHGLLNRARIFANGSIIDPRESDLLMNFNRHTAMSEAETLLLKELRKEHMLSMYNLEFPSIGIRRADEIRSSANADSSVSTIDTLFQSVGE